MKRCGLGMILALGLSAIAAAQDMQLQVELVGPLQAKKSFKGDRVLARVITPEALKGDIIDGVVKDSRPRAITFTLEMLRHPGQTIPIAAQAIAVTNSKGQPEVDEEGRALQRNAKAPAGAPIEIACQQPGMRFEQGTKITLQLAPVSASQVAAILNR
jgi:hypothetical protein